jgi:hypothetical protein
MERYLKDSPASHRPFHLYASISLFGMTFPVCVEVAETVRFYHAVYRIVYHPQVSSLLPLRLPTTAETCAALTCTSNILFETNRLDARCATP